MQISGLVITTNKESDMSTLQNRLTSFSDLDFGSFDENRIAAVVETEHQHESKHLVGMIEQFPEVSHVDVVFVHFGEEDDVGIHSKLISSGERLWI